MNPEKTPRSSRSWLYRERAPSGCGRTRERESDARAASESPLPATAPASAPAAEGRPPTPRLPPGTDSQAVRDWFEFETIISLPAPALSFAEAGAAADYRRAARAENTRRAYRTAVAHFTDWCAEHAQTALPAAPETVAAFLAAEAGSGLAVNTLRLRHAALRYLHLLAGYPPRPSPAVAQKDRPGTRPVARPPSGRSPTVCPGGVIAR